MDISTAPMSTMTVTTIINKEQESFISKLYGFHVSRITFHTLGISHFILMGVGKDT